MPLVDSDTWIEKAISLNQLQFHPNNPRLPEMDGKASEREIIHELCKRSDVGTIARAIADKGWLRNDRLIVVKEGKKNLVYEGNRRLCALKVLANPDLAPASQQKLFRKLSERTKLPKKVRVDVVPSKFDAEVVMYAKHAGEVFTVGWDPLQQATFVAAKVHDGHSIKDLAAHGFTREQVVECLAAVDLYRMCRLANGPAADRLRDDPAKFPYSTIFERLVKPKATREALGFEFTEKGLKAPAEEEILPVLTRILEDEAADDSSPRKINTRKLNTEEQQVRYVKGLKFTPSGKSKATAEEMEARRRKEPASSPTDGEVGKPKGAQPVPVPAKSTTRLLPKSFVCEVNSQKLGEMVREGKDLDINETPTACAVMLRCILELSLHVAIDVRGSKSAIATHHKKNPDELNIATLLQDVYDATIFDLGLDPSEKRGIPMLVGKGGCLSVEMLHLYVHNPHWPASPTNVLQLREAILPILRKAMSKP